jgi:starch phosphorylase
MRLRDNPKMYLGKVIYIISGRPSPASKGKKILEYIINIAKFINKDSIASNFMKIIYIPNYSVSITELLVKSSDTT